MKRPTYGNRQVSMVQGFAACLSESTCLHRGFHPNNFKGRVKTGVTAIRCFVIQCDIWPVLLESHPALRFGRSLAFAGQIRNNLKCSEIKSFGGRSSACRSLRRPKTLQLVGIEEGRTDEAG